MRSASRAKSWMARMIRSILFESVTDSACKTEMSPLKMPCQLFVVLPRHRFLKSALRYVAPQCTDLEQSELARSHHVSTI